MECFTLHNSRARIAPNVPLMELSVEAEIARPLQEVMCMDEEVRE